MNISPVSLVVGYPTNLIVAWKNRKAINWKLCLALTALVILGNIPGAYLLKNADTGIIKVVLVPFMLLSLFLGMKLSDRINEKQQEGS